MCVREGVSLPPCFKDPSLRPPQSSLPTATSELPSSIYPLSPYIALYPLSPCRGVITRLTVSPATPLEILYDKGKVTIPLPPPASSHRFPSDATRRGMSRPGLPMAALNSAVKGANAVSSPAPHTCLHAARRVHNHTGSWGYRGLHPIPLASPIVPQCNSPKYYILTLMSGWLGCSSPTTHAYCQWCDMH